MSYPCKTSKNGGQHKWSILKFTTKNRDEFVQSCRYCGTIRWGKFEMISGRVIKDIAWKYSDGLENDSSNVHNPGLVGDISTETGIIGTPEPNNEGAD